MGWSYRFADLTDPQKEHRRLLLDSYGLIAQVSAGVILLVIQLVFLIQWLSKRQQTRSEPETPGSPGLKYSQKGRHRVQAVERWWRLFAWWAGDSLEIFGTQFGTKGQITAAAFWTLWLLFLSFSETGDGKYYCLMQCSISLRTTQTTSILRKGSASLEPLSSRSTIFSSGNLLGHRSRL